MDEMIILFTAMVPGNIALTYFLGMCPFVSMSKKLDVAVGMGTAVTLVMIITSITNFLLLRYVLIPLNIEHIKFLVFIITIAMLVQIVEMFIYKFSPVLYSHFGIFLPLITVNCSILGISIFMNIRSYSLIETFFSQQVLVLVG